MTTWESNGHVTDDVTSLTRPTLTNRKLLMANGMVTLPMLSHGPERSSHDPQICFKAYCFNNGWRYRLVYNAAPTESRIFDIIVTCPLRDPKGQGRPVTGRFAPRRFAPWTYSTIPAYSVETQVPSFGCFILMSQCAYHHHHHHCLY